MRIMRSHFRSPEKDNISCISVYEQGYGASHEKRRGSWDWRKAGKCFKQILESERSYHTTALAYYNAADYWQPTRRWKGKKKKSFGLSSLLHSFIWISHRPVKTDRKLMTGLEPTRTKAEANEISQDPELKNVSRALILHQEHPAECSWSAEFKHNFWVFLPFHTPTPQPLTGNTVFLTSHDLLDDFYD